MRADIVIVGGGIVGLATAYKLTERFPGKRLIVLEKESAVARHQTGRNSGVIHSGIYYRSGSVKAVTCRDGRGQLIRFCEAEGIPFDICGKVIVARDAAEIPALQRIHERGRANGVHCEPIEVAQIREREPHAAGSRGLWVRDTGIVDYAQVCEKLALRLIERGQAVMLESSVGRIEERAEGVMVDTSRGTVEAGRLVNCAGLFSDRIARMAGASTDAQIVPFRGEYFRLRQSAEPLCRNLIYPVPDARFPFLGVHFTRMIGGGVECGPNAVLAFAREGYTKGTVRLADLWETLAYRGFRRMALQHVRMGLGELVRSFVKPAFVREAQRLIPEICGDDLVAAEAGVRAQAVLPNGTLLDDFSFAETARTAHVINAVSPAATAAFSIADEVVSRMADRLE